MTFPDVQSRLQKRLSKIDVDPARVPNNQLIRRFANDCLVVGLGPVRVHKYLYHLKWMAKWLGKDFREVDESGIRALVGKIETSSFAANTKRDFSIAIKKLFSWLSEVGESQVSTDWIKTGKGANRIIIPSNLLTVENIPQVLRACETIQERALASFLYDTGCRVGELLNVKMKDVEIMKDFARVRLDGKTGTPSRLCHYVVPRAAAMAGVPSELRRSRGSAVGELGEEETAQLRELLTDAVEDKEEEWAEKGDVPSRL